MRGIISHAGYVPYNRLQRSAIGEVMGRAPGGGTRSVASYDEDTTTMGVAAGRLALRSLASPASAASPVSAVSPGSAAAAGSADATLASIDQLWFATAEPAYLEKTNATTIHAALRLDTDIAALDFGGAARSGIGSLKAALSGAGTTLVVASDIRTGLPTGADESAGGDGATAFLIGTEGEDGDAPVIAQYLGGASASSEFMDRWRQPGDARTKTWAERYSETRYRPLAEQAWNEGLKAAGVTAEQVDRVIVTGVHPRAVRSVSRGLGVAKEAFVDDLARTVGNTGTAHPSLLLSSVLESAGPGQVIAVLMLADGADVIVLRTTDAIADHRPARTIAAQVEGGNDELLYGKYLTWRGELTPEPPRRPEPDRVSGSAAGRNSDWKYGFVGSTDRESGAVHLPPARVSMTGGNVDDMDATPMADVPATIVTFTVDRVSYSPSPPIVAAIVDFDGGGRMPCELTDCTADEIRLGDRVEMTFRRLHSSDGIHNYFWKARPARGGEN